jgi:hypothetical protein
MNTYRSGMPKQRKHLSATVLGAAAIVAAISGLAQPAVSHAEKYWDVGSYDNCVRVADNRMLSGQTTTSQYWQEVRFCCDRSGGEWQSGRCTAPPMTGPPPQDGPIVQTPGTGTAQTVDPPQTGPVTPPPGTATATETPPAPQAPKPPPIVRDHRKR